MREAKTVITHSKTRDTRAISNISTVVRWKGIRNDRRAERIDGNAAREYRIELE